MKRISYILVFVLMTFLQAMAQGPFAEGALVAYQNNEWDKATRLIDSAIVSPSEAGDAFTWHLRGFIYRDVYKQVDKEDRYSKARPIAIESFFKSNELDKNNDFTARNNGSLKSIIVSYYNDAVRLMDTTNYAESEKFYNEYKKQTQRLTPGTDFTKSDVEYYNALATVLVKKYNRMDKGSDEFFNQAIRVYEKVVELDSANCLAHYQIGILYYNKGVEILLNLDPTTPLEDIVKAQETCVDLFLLSKPHMYKAWELQNCKDINPLEIAEGLSGIHYQLNEPDKFKYWEDLKKKLQEGQDK
ncbi:MAG: tetratricopeptide repeat protein [Flavobacteriales bacterium]|nr:tetratricopeptide repeat protein [Flavobacteriales bacterium]